MVRQLVFGILILVTLIPILPNIYAENFQTAKPTLFHYVFTFIEDVRLSVASGEDKARLALEFADSRQNDIDNLFQNGKRIPQAIEDRRIELVEIADSSEIQATASNKIVCITEPCGKSDGGIVKKITRELVTLSELNEIKILYSEFQTCIKTCTDAEKRDFNDRVNSLSSWKTRCTGTFDIDDYQNDMGSLDRIKGKCSDLQGKNVIQLKKVLNVQCDRIGGC